MVKKRKAPEAPRSFQGKDKGEVFHFCFHQHWIRLAWPFVKMLVYSGALIGIGYLTLIRVGIADASLRHVIMTAFVAGFFFIQVEFIARFYRYFLYVIVVTDKKIHRIKKTLLLTDDHQSIDLWMLQDINKCQHGLLQNVLGYGSLILEAQDTLLRLHFVPRINKRYERLMRLRESARRVISHSTRVMSNEYLPKQQPAPTSQMR